METKQQPVVTQQQSPMNTHVEKVRKELEKVGVRTVPRDNLYEHRNSNCKTLSLYYAKDFETGTPTTEREGYFGFIVIDNPENENYQIETWSPNPKLWNVKYCLTNLKNAIEDREDYPVWYTNTLDNLKNKMKDLVFYSNNPLGKKSTHVHPDTSQNLEGESPMMVQDYFSTGAHVGKFHYIKSRGRLTIVPKLDDPGRAWLSKQFRVDKNHIKFQSFPEFKKNGGKMKKKRTNMFFNRKNRF